MRHTKIIATAGPATDSDAMLDAIIAAGTDVVRLNFSHGTQASHAATFARVRAAARRARREIAILQDLGGPKIRTGRLANGAPIRLAPGDRLVIATGNFAGGPGRISTTFAGLARGVRAGDRLLLADGAIELRVEATDGNEITTSVVEGGALGEHKGINAPGVPLQAAALTDKDRDDLQFGLTLGVDMVGLSFVRRVEDLQQAREAIASHGRADVTLIAKLERPEAIEHLGEILSHCDAVMVARGDLGLELPLEQVPRIQKQVIRRARHHGIPVIVATQVLESMTKEARPTRAEVSDAANAVADGSDAVMLSAETAVGLYPARAVETLAAIIREAELGPADEAAGVIRRLTDDHDHVRALCAAAVTLAARGDARGIVAVTSGGSTARHLSALRPGAPIFAVTANERTARRLALHWGVVPICLDAGELENGYAHEPGRLLVARGHMEAGDTSVTININPDLNRTDANYLRIQRW